MALEHVINLARMHKHAAHLGGLIGAPHPPFDTGIGAPAGADPRQHRRHVAGGETDQRIGRVEIGHHHLADLAIGDRVAGARP